jgi:hypothetical protein
LNSLLKKREKGKKGKINPLLDHESDLPLSAPEKEAMNCTEVIGRQ